MKPFILSIVVFISSNCIAQVYLETDPFAYALGGHSIHLGIQGNGLRVQIGSFGAEYPDAFKQNDNFDVYQSGYGAKVDYYGKSYEGAFIGIEYGHTVSKYSLESNSIEVEEEIRFVGIRIGTKYMLTKSLYIMPWIGVDQNISNNDKVEINGEIYKINKTTIFPTIHLGLEF